MTTPLMYAVQAAALWSGLLILMMPVSYTHLTLPTTPYV